ncbi:MAG: DNA translocase FtsK 4TM domain-containing protein, partial [Desulfovibrio sp.]|nr:DNA translocase FtsK 4TM domain-containing protein [Desulfovibrio sp.]
MEQTKEQSPRKSGFAREMTALFLLFWAMFILLSLFSFDKNDPSLNQVTSAAIVQNKAGLFGAYVSGFLNEWFGLCSFLWPVFFIILAFSCVSQRFALNWRRWLAIFFLILCFLVAGEAWEISAGDFSPGGIAGHGLYLFTTHYLHPLGASLLWLFILMIAVELLLDISWFAIFARLGRTIQAKMHEKPRDPNLLVLEKAELPKASEGKRRLFSFLARFLKRPVSPAPPMPELYSEKDEDQAKKRKADPSISQNTPLLQEKEPEPLFQP